MRPRGRARLRWSSPQRVPRARLSLPQDRPRAPRPGRPPSSPTPLPRQMAAWNPSGEPPTTALRSARPWSPPSSPRSPPLTARATGCSAPTAACTRSATPATRVVPEARCCADPVVAAAATPDGAGYWLVTSVGQVMAFGDAVSYGSITTPIRAHVVAMVATTDGKGYWIACSTGGVFNFGDALCYGSAKAGAAGLPDRRHGGNARRRRVLARRRERDPVQLRRRAAPGAAVCGDRHVARRRSRGHRETAREPGWPSRTAPSSASAPPLPAVRSPVRRRPHPVIAIAAVVVPPPSNLAYDLAESNGRVAGARGGRLLRLRVRHALVAPIVALVSTPDRKGYWLVGADGSVYPFGDASY